MNRTDTELLHRSGACIRKRRRALNLTQTRLAELCGPRRTFVGSVENGERSIAVLSVRKIATAQSATTAELLADLGAPTAKT